MNLIIPMAGNGSRFREAGYSTPKPFLPLGSRAMISQVIQNVAEKDWSVFPIMLPEHFPLFQYELESGLRDVANICPVCIHGQQTGALTTVLAFRQYFENDEPLVIANSDQWIEFMSIGDKRVWFDRANSGENTIMTFKSGESRWSYAQLDETGHVVRVAEKKVISPWATTGVYSFRSGRDFCKYADQLVENNDRTNGEFYLAPVYNYIAKEQPVRTLEVQMYGLGIPQDYEINKPIVESKLQDFEKEGEPEPHDIVVEYNQSI